jgi:hypothetical protein
MRERCYWACQLLSRRCDEKLKVPFAAIGRILGEDRGHVKRNWEIFMEQGNECKSPGRHCKLDPEEHEEMILEILAGFARNRPLTVSQVCRIISERWSKDMLTDTVYRILARDDRIKTCQAKPIEEARLAVTDEEILTYFRDLYSYVHGVPAHFVANMDEMGHQPFADAKDLLCFVPSDYDKSAVRYPVSRIGKRITLIGTIFADGSYLKPGLVIPRQTYDDNVLCRGYTREKLEIYTQKKGYIDKDIFEDWAQDVLVPEIRRRREQHQYHGPMILILDNCSAHHGEAFEQLCADNNIIRVWLPPHASHLLQMLDLCVFGVTKKFLNRMNSGDTKYVQSDHIVKVLDSFHAACSCGNICASFSLGGISVLLDGEGITRCIVTPQTAARVLHIYRDQESRLADLLTIGEEEEDDDEYVPEDPLETENIRAVVQEIREMFESG